MNTPLQELDELMDIVQGFTLNGLIMDDQKKKTVKRKFTDLVRKACIEVIGKDEFVMPGLFIDRKYKADPQIRNHLRASQRAELERLLKNA